MLPVQKHAQAWGNPVTQQSTRSTQFTCLKWPALFANTQEQRPTYCLPTTRTKKTLSTCHLRVFAMGLLEFQSKSTVLPSIMKGSDSADAIDLHIH